MKNCWIILVLLLVGCKVKEPVNEEPTEEVPAVEIDMANYDDVVRAADKAFNEGDWSTALNLYETASTLDQGATYPLEKMQQVATIRAEETDYCQEFVRQGDNASVEESWDQAIYYYEKAVEMCGDATYLLERITIIEEMSGEDEDVPAPLVTWQAETLSAGIGYDDLNIDEVLLEVKELELIIYESDRNLFMAVAYHDGWANWQVTDVPGAPYQFYDIEFTGYELVQVNGIGSEELVIDYFYDWGGTSGDVYHYFKSCWDIDAQLMLFDIEYKSEQTGRMGLDEYETITYVNEEGDTITENNFFASSERWGMTVDVIGSKVAFRDLYYHATSDETYVVDFQLIEEHEATHEIPDWLIEQLPVMGVYMYRNGEYVWSE